MAAFGCVKQPNIEVTSLQPSDHVKPARESPKAKASTTCDEESPSIVQRERKPLPSTSTKSLTNLSPQTQGMSCVDRWRRSNSSISKRAIEGKTSVPLVSESKINTMQPIPETPGCTERRGLEIKGMDRLTIDDAIPEGANTPSMLDQV
mmetsp:Transcript_27718/g.51693  ORF Transcript_27718/g.51693 Transcript_27718/m.51693 type:complete len:149 (-) Transcript_27718:116-562(-)|eukprot:CAMPEP_0170198564 /NCGR_PEP_ID=MMETSP0040_2-20121228/68848_1 /TAXON_ID=641309 /ORGANISM="Lotharella oceanica, Strain CCMP622" /LENGTH=148 /DNA_ID=CAMNT_0010448575 /DNA_START=1699 /DNA_END=2145 /DNA_ORIENTATION=-